jgi:predicted NAD/FAD-binding protein
MVQSAYSTYRAVYQKASRFVPRHLAAIAAAEKIEAAAKRAESALATLTALV